MKRTGLLILCLLIVAQVSAQSLARLKEPVFKSGEQLDYKLRYGFLTAAEGHLSVTDGTFEGKPVFHLTARGQTAGTFEVFYKVNNLYESYIDAKTLLPYLYTEAIKEGNYRRSDRVTFNQSTKKVISREKGTFTFKGDLLDLVSAYYYARNLDISKLKPGSKINLQYFLIKDVSSLGITYVGKEQIKTSMGTFNCLKFNPTIKPGRIFKESSKLYLWVTDDGNRIPVKAQVEILVGKVTMELTGTKGLKYPLDSKVK